jgi:hypothetical protein
MKKKLTIGKTRSALYKAAKILGDVNSIKRGTVGKRLTGRVVGKVSGRVFSRVTRKLFKMFRS